MFEFGPNWLLVSDIFSSTVRLFGIHRRPEACHEKFRQHLVRLCPLLSRVQGLGSGSGVYCAPLGSSPVGLGPGCRMWCVATF